MCISLRCSALWLWMLLFLSPGGWEGQTTILFFVTSDCPISNAYAPEIQRICTQYRSKGVACSLVYEDVSIHPADVRGHLDEYRYRGIPYAIDRDRAIANKAGATVTPQAVVTDESGAIRYRGRIDNRYEQLGKPRRVVTVRDLRDAVDAVLAGKPVTSPETTALGCYIVSPDILRKSP